MAILSLASSLAKDGYRNGRKGTLHVALTLSFLLARGCAHGDGTTTQDPQTHHAAHTGETSEAVTGGGGESAVYIWITSFAIFNTFFLLVVLLYTVCNIYSMKMQAGMDIEKKDNEVKTKPRKFIDSLSVSQYFPFPSHHNSQSSKKVEDNCQVHTDPSPAPELRTSIERKNWSPKPALPSTCPPPCPSSKRASLQDFQPCPNSNPKTFFERRKDLQLPPLPSNCTPQPHPERPRSQNTPSSEDDDHEYEYIELPIRPTPTQKKDQEDSKKEETNEKKKENNKQGTNESDEEENDYDYIRWPVKQHQTADKETQTNEIEEASERSIKHMSLSLD